jgi:acetyltransferase-like isoleucine patch superfamily enzyme
MLSALKSSLKALLFRTRHRHVGIGRDCNVAGSSFGRHVALGDDVTVLTSVIGDYSYVGPRTVICHTSIGKFCSLAADVSLGTGTHPSRDFVSSHPIFYLRRPSAGWTFADTDYRQEFQPTQVGNDVWIGLRASIRDGIRIGNGAIVGAGAVVVGDLEPYGVYVGVPARLVRHRFTAAQIEFLERFKWWDRDEAWMRANFRGFHDIERFISENGGT